MALTAQFLHSRPQREIASLLSIRFARCRTAAVVAGFVTPDGVDALEFAGSSHAPRLLRLVVGAGTYRAFEAIDRLIPAVCRPLEFVSTWGTADGAVASATRSIGTIPCCTARCISSKWTTEWLQPLLGPTTLPASRSAD